jgi:hypothetical protein
MVDRYQTLLSISTRAAINRMAYISYTFYLSQIVFLICSAEYWYGWAGAG